MRNLAATVLLGLSFTLPAPAQEQPERLGLVLSGGGAKGLAHIGVLKVLEEEGIRPEVITGTSMGALIGGLYACGYSAGQIEEMVLGIHWGDLLTNKLPLDRIAMEEKPYYGRFLLELPFNGIRPQLPSGLIRGQKIDELLRRQTLPWHGTTSFDSLPIPFACIATDVGNGRAVVMRTGLLPDAMRASMSIPTAFTPLVLENQLLVDGGAMRNFPASDAQAMGATLVIGVSVGDGLMPAKDLRNAVDILTQATMFKSLLEDPDQAARCAVLLRPDISGYGTTSFSEEAVPVLIQRGYDEADRHRGQLRALGAKLPAARQHLAPPRGVVLPDSFRVDCVVVDADRQSTVPLIEGRLSNKGGMTVKDLEQRIDLLYGSLHFDLITYHMDPEPGDSVLVVKALTAPQERLGISLNYDNFNQASAGVLLVSRDRLLKSSRAVLEAYVSRYPSVEAGWMKYAGPSRRLALTAGGHYARGPFYLRRPGTDELSAELLYDRYGGHLRVQTASSVTSLFGSEIAREYMLLKPRLGDDVLYVAEDTVRIELSNVERVRSARWAARIFFQFNSTERPIYPRRGWKITAMAGHYWDAFTTTEFNDQAPAEQGYAGATVRLNDYTDFQRAYVHAEGLLPLGKRWSAMLSGDATMGTERIVAPGDMLLVGGMKANGRESFPFWGLSEYQETLPEFAILRAGMQWELARDVFWQVQANGLFSSWRPDPVLLVNGRTALYGAGSTLGLRTGLGILQLGVAGNADLDEVLGYFNFGFRL